MNQTDQLTQVARKRADDKIDAALGALRKAARKIGKEHGVPENIAGHSIEELLGRIAYVPSMARDLRRAAGQEMAKVELEALLSGHAAPTDPPPIATPGRPPSAPPGPAPYPPPPPASARAPIEPSTIPDAIPVGMDLHDLSGVTVQTIRALKDAGIKTVGDVVVVPDEHLLKIKGVAEKSLAQLRQAIGEASQRKPPGVRP